MKLDGYEDILIRIEATGDTRYSVEEVEALVEAVQAAVAGHRFRIRQYGPMDAMVQSLKAEEAYTTRLLNLLWDDD